MPCEVALLMVCHFEVFGFRVSDRCLITREYSVRRCLQMYDDLIRYFISLIAPGINLIVF